MTKMPDAPSLDEVLGAANRYALAGLNFSAVAIVQAYDSAKRMATVLPMVRRIGINGDPVELPAISDVPVDMPGTPIAGIQFDIPRDTTGLLIFTDAALDRWLSMSRPEIAAAPVVTPLRQTAHGLSDAVFLPGVSPFNAARATEPGILEVYNGVGRIKIDATGRMKIGTEIVDLLSLLDQLLDALTAGVTVGTAATQTFDPATKLLFSKIKAQLATIKL